MLTIKNETQTSADVYIYGTIVDDEDGGLVADWCENTYGYHWPKDLKRQLDGLRGKSLNIYINSYGGLISAGLAMAHLVERHDGQTTAIVDGYCCSIATQIFFAADKCVMYPNSYLMIHKPFSALVGNAAEMRETADMLDTLQTGLESSYQKKALDGVTVDEIHDMVEQETWLTGTEAAKKFKIELRNSSTAMNCVGSREKLTSIGVKKIPAALSFKAETRQPDLTDIEIALARAKGVV